MLSLANGGRVVEATWRLVSEGAERLDQWTELCEVAVTAVTHYITTHGRPTLASRMGGEEPWPILMDSDEPDARPTVAAVDPDEGYIPRRAQEWLLSGPPGGDARQYAAMLGAQLAAHYHA